MHLLILRHAIAVQRGTISYVNDDRPLTDDGIRKMERAAQGIVAVCPPVHAILTSPLRRAHQTAGIVAAALGCLDKVIVSEAFLPAMDTDTQIMALRKFGGTRTIMVVGHEPDLGILASRILGAGNSVIEFRKGSLCCLTVSRRGMDIKGILNWHLTPRQLRLLGKRS